MIAKIHNEWFIPLERTGLILKQAEWNIIQMGNDKFLNKCKRVHFKNIAIESKEGDPQQSLKFIRRSELSWSEAAKPTVSSLKYVQHTAAPLYKVCSAASCRWIHFNFTMFKCARTTIQCCTFIMLSSCRLILCNKHRLKRQHQASVLSSHLMQKKMSTGCGGCDKYQVWVYSS